MRNKQLSAIKILAAISMTAAALIATACGESEKEPPVVPTQVGLAATVAPGLAVTATRQVVATPSLGTQSLNEMASEWLKPAPFELENVRYGGTMRGGGGPNGSVGNFEPMTNATILLGQARLMYEKLLGWVANENDDYTHLEPMLAENWKASADLKTYTYSIRKGVKWHNIPPVNGRELTADDVVFSLNRYRELGSTQLANYSQVGSIEAPDRYTVVIKLKEPSAWLNNDLFGSWQYIVPPELVKEENGTIKTKVIGSGPYILKEYVFRQKAIVVRNPDYWGKDAKGNPLPYVDEIAGNYIVDPSTTIAAFRTGQQDVIAQGAENVALLLKTNPNLRVFKNGQPRPPGYAFNTTHAPWNDIRVRRAFNMALDKQKMAQSMFATNNIFWTGPVRWIDVSDKPFTFDDYGPYYKYNPQESKRLLIEAGFPNGKVTVPSVMVYNLASAAVSDSKRALILQQLWKEEGITLQIEQWEVAAFQPYHLNRLHKDIGHIFQPTGDFSLNWYAQNKFKADSLINAAFINDPEVEKVVRAIKVETDPAKLRQYARFLWDYDTLGSYNIWIPEEYGYIALSSRVRNYVERTNSGAGTGQMLLPWLADAPRVSP